MSHKANHSAYLRPYLLFWVAVSGSICFLLGAPFAEKKEKAGRKGSEAVRQNPLIRDHFRARAMSMQPSLKDNKRTLDSTVDFLLDDFVERSQKLAQKMADETEALCELAPQYRALSLESSKGGKLSVDRGLLDRTRTKVDAIKNATKSLEAQMDFLSQALRLSIKVHETNVNALGVNQVTEDIEKLQSLVTGFRTSLDEFLFPKDNTIALVDMQKAALPVQLKRIERYAERIEMAVKKMR